MAYHAYHMPTIPKSTRTYAINVRLDATEYELVSTLAKAAKTDRATLLRSYLHENGSGIDRKHEELLGAMRKLQQSNEKVLGRLELVAHMSASIAGGLVSLPGQRLGDTEAMEARKNVLQAFGLAEALLKAQGDLFAKKGG